MTSLLQDVRYAVRMLVRSPGFAAVAVLTLALGIGANTALFSIVYTALLKPLPFEQADRLYMLWANPDAARGRGGAASPADFLDWRSENTVFEDIAGMNSQRLTLTGAGDPVRLLGTAVTSGFFRLLRVAPHIGRTFTPEEELTGGPEVIILAHHVWKERFAGDPRVVGRTLTFDSTPHTVVGVMPAGFDFPRVALGRPVNYWVPFRIDPARASRGAHFFAVIGRLKDGVTRERAQAQMDTISTRLQQAYPDTNTNWFVNLFTLREEIVGDSRTALLMLLGAVGFVLLIACANVANLLLARATIRAKELAVRAALGASRARLLRQLLVESVVLALAGAGLGILLAAWGLELASGMIEAWVPRASEVELNLPTLAFTAAAAVVTGLLFGLAPALHVSRDALNRTLKGAGRGSVGAGHRRLRTALVVGEVALAFVLLIGAGLLIRSFQQLQNVRPGFQPDRMLTAVLNLPEARYDTLARQTAFTGPLLERVRRIPEVRQAALASFVPMDGKETLLGFSVDGEPDPPPSEFRLAQWRVVSDRFFETMGVPLLNGRTFAASDTEGAPAVAVISRSLAQRYFSTKDPIGQRVTIDDAESETRRWFTVVGVVEDVRYRSLAEKPQATLYYPAAQQTFPEFTLVARTGPNPLGLTNTIQGLVRGLDPAMALADVRTLEQVVSGSIAGARFRTLLLLVFAVLALALSAIGVYGVMSYSVEQRRPEMGLRMALGASPRDVLRLVTADGVRLAVAGLALGVAASLALTRVLESLLFEVRATDPLTFGGIAVLLAAVAVLASYIPARRATRADPMLVLRAE